MVEQATGNKDWELLNRPISTDYRPESSNIDSIYNRSSSYNVKDFNMKKERSSQLINVS